MESDIVKERGRERGGREERIERDSDKESKQIILRLQR